MESDGVTVLASRKISAEVDSQQIQTFPSEKEGMKRIKLVYDMNTPWFHFKYA